jgi:DEAD/DEAH box helicase domain-containing protein
VDILQAASRDHIPIAPKSHKIETTARNDLGPIKSIPDSQSRPSVEQVLREITGRQSEDYESEDLNDFIGFDWYKGQIVYRKTFQALPGRIGFSVFFPLHCCLKEPNVITGSLDNPLSHTISHALKTSRNISSLYTHQAVSINAIREGRNVVVSTSTASGKSIIYQVFLSSYVR